MRSLEPQLSQLEKNLSMTHYSHISGSLKQEQNLKRDLEKQ